MLNKDYYKDAIFELAFKGRSIAIVDGEPVDCSLTPCMKCSLQGMPTGCRTARIDWANSEFVEKIDWTKVKKDTPVLVKNHLTDCWTRRYFAKFEGGHVWVYNDGCTSWSASSTGWWKYAKLSPITDETGTN